MDERRAKSQSRQMMGCEDVVAVLGASKSTAYQGDQAAQPGTGKGWMHHREREDIKGILRRKDIWDKCRMIA